MFTLTVLVAAVLTVEVLRAWMVLRPTTKKTYFKVKQRGVDSLIKDLEFTIFKQRELREGVRRDRDERFMKLEAIKARIIEGESKGGMKKTDPDEFSRLEDQRELLTKEVERFESQIDMLEGEIEGRKPDAEFQDGQPGLVDKLDAYYELKNMIKEYIKI